MIALAILVGLVTLLVISFISGNQQANDLMKKLGGEFEAIPLWDKYPTAVYSLILSIFIGLLYIWVFGWIGALFIPVSFMANANISRYFLKRQLERGLVHKQANFKEISQHKHIDQTYGEIHRINELKWLVNHPKSAQHMALAKNDNSINPAIYDAFIKQVKEMDDRTLKSYEK